MQLFTLACITDEHSHGALVDLENSPILRNSLAINAKEFHDEGITGIAQEEFILSELVVADFVDTSSSVPLFSERAKTVLSSCGELEFHKCIVRYNTTELTFYAGKVLKHLQLIRSFPKGKMYPTYFEEIPQDFWIARDANWPTYSIYASDKFVELCLQNKLNIIFYLIDRRTGEFATLT